MKIRKVTVNNHKKSFELVTYGKQAFSFPFGKLEIQPSPDNPVSRVYVDKELGREAFSYELEDGREGTVHLDHVLEYNRDPAWLRDMMLYKLTLAAQTGVQESRLSKREIIRRLGTSPAQFYRLLDQTNYKKSLDQMVALLGVLDCDVEIVVTPAGDERQQVA